VYVGSPAFATHLITSAATCDRPGELTVTLPAPYNKCTITFSRYQEVSQDPFMLLLKSRYLLNFLATTRACLTDRIDNADLSFCTPTELQHLCGAFAAGGIQLSSTRPLVRPGGSWDWPAG
jgi:hypothetical protein